MATFLQNLSTKLELASDPQIISLGTVTSTPTTADTLVTLASYSSPSLASFDLIQSEYIFTVANASVANETFTVTFNHGTARTGSFTVNASVTATIVVTVRMVKTTGGFVTTVMMTDGTTVVRHNLVLAITAVDQLTYTVLNTTTAATVTVSGLGGNVVLDRLT